MHQPTRGTKRGLIAQKRQSRSLLSRLEPALELSAPCSAGAGYRGRRVAIRTAIILFLLFILPSDALAQLVRDHEAQGLGSFHGPASRIRRSFQSDTEARTVFKHTLAVAGLAGMEDRMSIRASAETDNAEAFIERTPDKEERLILYNAVFMQEIAKKTKDYWSMIAIVAHEVGHHIRLHTMTGEARSCSEMIVGMGSVEAGEFLARDGAGANKAQVKPHAIN